MAILRRMPLARLTGSDRILFSTSLRAALAAAVPFLTLRALDHPVGALFATIGVLFISIADAGGPYRQRLTVMCIVTIIVPIMLFAGMHIPNTWYWPTLLMFIIAALGGMTRLLGNAGIAIGLQSGLGFIVGIYIPATLLGSLEYIGYFLLGAIWTILVALTVWRIRPYRRIRYQVGECLQQAARTFALIGENFEAETAAFAKQLSEQQMHNRQAQEEAESLLGEIVSQNQTPPPFLSDLIVLLHLSSSLNANAQSIASALPPKTIHELPSAMKDTIVTLTQLFEANGHALAEALLTDVPYRAPEAIDRCLEQFKRLWAEISGHPHLSNETISYFEASLQHLQIAEHATTRLAGGKPARLWLLPPLPGPVFPGFGLHQVRINLSFESLIFRHALRVGLAAALGTALYLVFRIPHGIWLPLTILLVLQPHLGATLPRALHRVAGTLIGAVVAAILILLLSGTAGIEAAILVCIFGAVFFVRRQYWIAVVFITPLIILLLNLLTHNPWVEIIERIGNTLGGAAIALLAGYLLWPQSEARSIPGYLQDAIKANRDYLVATLRQFSTSRVNPRTFSRLRNEAELKIGNADAALLRLAAEPRSRHRRLQTWLVATTYLQRLSRHITRLSLYAQQQPDLQLKCEELSQMLEATLSELSKTMAMDGTCESHLPDPESLYAQFENTQLRIDQNEKTWVTVGFQLSEIVDDIANLGRLYQGAISDAEKLTIRDSATAPTSG